MYIILYWDASGEQAADLGHIAAEARRLKCKVCLWRHETWSYGGENRFQLPYISAYSLSSCHVWYQYLTTALERKIWRIISTTRLDGTGQSRLSMTPWWGLERSYLADSGGSSIARRHRGSKHNHANASIWTNLWQRCAGVIFGGFESSCKSTMKIRPVSRQLSNLS